MQISQATSPECNPRISEEVVFQDYKGCNPHHMIIKELQNQELGFLIRIGNPQVVEIHYFYRKKTDQITHKTHKVITMTIIYNSQIFLKTNFFNFKNTMIV